MARTFPNAVVGAACELGDACELRGVDSEFEQKAAKEAKVRVRRQRGGNGGLVRELQGEEESQPE